MGTNSEVDIVWSIHLGQVQGVLVQFLNMREIKIDLGLGFFFKVSLVIVVKPRSYIN
jgi:hypothetical protein